MSGQHWRRLSLVIVIAALTTTGPLQARQPAAAEGDVATAPVEIDGTVLYRVRGVSSFPAAARAGAIRERLVAVASDRSIPVDAIRTVESEGISRIVAGDTTVMTVVDADAALEQVQRPELAAAHASRIRQAVSEYRVARSPEALRSAGIAVLAATVVLAGVFALAVWFWRWLDRLLARRVQARIHSLEIKEFEVVRAERIWRMLQSALFGLRTLAFLAVGLTYLGFVLARFPWTRGISRDLAAFVLAPLALIGRGIVAQIPNLVFLTVLFFVFRVALRVIRLFFDGLARGTVTLGKFDADWAEPTYKIIRILVIAFGLIVAYPYIPGSESDAFKGVSLFLGIVFSLGSSSAISNIVAGYMMTYRRAFKVGDRVKIGNSVGEVIETRLQVTHLRTPKNEEVIIPNSQILSAEVLNYSSLARTHGLILHTEVGIGYETPWRQVEAMLIMAARRTPGLSEDPPPFVHEKGLADFAVTYELNAYCTDVKRMIPLYSELRRNILDVFNEYGVQIMTPAYKGDPETPKVVARKDWYLEPAASPAVAPAVPAAAPAAPAVARGDGVGTHG